MMEGARYLLVVALATNILVASGSVLRPKAKEPITFDEVMNREFSAKSFRGQWYSDTKIQLTDTGNNIVTWDVETNATEILVSAEVAESLGSPRFFGLCPSSSSLLLFATEITQIWRHSFEAKYFVYNAESGTVIDIFPVGSSPGAKLQYAAWIPGDESRLVYVYENDVYVLNNPESGGGSEVRVTDDGIKDTFYNGKPDWVYEEEVLATDNAIYLSEDGEYLAFASFNDAEVSDFYYTKFGEPENILQYPENILIKYPKTGTPNPTVELKVKSLSSSGGVKPVVPPSEVLAFGEYLYTAASWTKAGVLTVIWMNRIQNEAVVSECTESGSNWQCKNVYAFDEADGWIEVFHPPVHKSDGEKMLLILPGTYDGLHYQHLAIIDIASGFTTFLSTGDWVVSDIVSWDEANGVVYFIGTKSGSPGSKHLYSVSEDGQSPSECITCDIAFPSGLSSCEYNVITMSPQSSYYIHKCSGPEVPEVVLRQSASGNVLFNLEKNAELKAKLANKAVPERLFFTVPVGDSWSAPVRMLVPEGYDPSGATKYPMIVDVYGGPISQEVTQVWSVGWGDFLVSTYGIIYVSIDGRGTGGQSNEFLFEVYKRLGTVEMEDQISVARTLQRDTPFIDASRSGIWGWSYGGYATTMILIKDVDNVFSCGISVAPPTNWLFYDTVYTERYMGLPQDNQVGYSGASVLDKVEALRGKKFMLNHGVADDNVHYQQSMLLIRALEVADIHFEQFSYPENNHGINNRVSRFLYREFERFWGECFDLDIVRTSGNSIETLI